MLSGLFLWAQAPAGLAPPEAQTAHACACCQGPKCTCCFDRSDSDSIPLSAAALNLAGSRLALADLVTAAEAPAELPLVQSPALQPARAADDLFPVPAYRRHCALLL